MKPTTHRKTHLILASLVFGALLVLVACAPRQGPAVPDSSEEETAVNVPVWSEDSDCASCHATEENSGADSATPYSMHLAQNEDVTCLTCHTDADGKLATVHADYATGTMPDRLRVTSIPESICLDCHSLETLKVATSFSTVLTDENGLVVNPHDLPINDSHEERAISCSTCHKMHGAGDLEETARSTCISCHHEGVYECNTCHGSAG